MADFEPDIKLIVTGSSSMTIKRFKDSLAGRKKSFTLYPLDFREFLVFKKKRQLFDVLDTFNLSKILSIRDNEIEERIAPFMNEIQQLFEEYVLYGGYPKVVLTQSREEKLFELNELLMSYELKDVNVLFNIGNISAFRNLFKILASSVGNLLNVNELAGTIGIGRDTVLRYLSILENTFIIHQLPPFHGNIRKELTKMPKIFFMDTGLRNYALRSFSELEFRPDKGSLFENAIFGELYKNLGITDQLYFWRTISKIEVDFVLNSADKIAFEVKFNAGPGQNRSPGLKAFGKIYKDFKQIIVTYNKYSDGRIKLVPSWMISS
jgi:predicted AAA+ superfamily ATPase